MGKCSSIVDNDVRGEQNVNQLRLGDRNFSSVGLTLSGLKQRETIPAKMFIVGNRRTAATGKDNLKGKAIGQSQSTFPRLARAAPSS